MPSFICPIMEIPEHIFKPVIEQVACRLLVNLDLKDVIKDNIYINTDFMSRTQTSTLEKDAIVNTEALRVDAQIQMNPTSQKWDTYTFTHTTAYGLNRNALAEPVPVYLDQNNGVRVVEIVSPVTIQMSCVISLESTTLAYRLPYHIYNQYGPSGLVHYEDLFYDYPVPKQIIHVLKGIYDLDRFNGKPTGIDFKAYLKKYANDQWVINENRAIPDEYEIVQNVRNLQALVTVDYTDDRPSVDKQDKSPHNFEMPVNVTLQFGIPNLYAIQYPVTICNTLLASKYLVKDTTTRFNRLLGQYHSSALNNYMKGEIQSSSKVFMDPGILRVPFYDDWIPATDSILRKCGHFIMAIIGLTVEENSTLFTTLNLKEFKDDNFTLAPFILDILRIEGPAAVFPTSLVSITIYANDAHLTPCKNVKMTKDLIITFHGTTLNKQYHLCISICRDLTKLNPRWNFLLAKYYHSFDVAFQRRIDALKRRGLISDNYEEDKDGNIIDLDTGFVVGNINGSDDFKCSDFAMDGEIDRGINNGIPFESRIIRSNIITHRRH